MPSVLASFDDPENHTAEEVQLEIGEGDFDEVLCAALVLREAAGPPEPLRRTDSMELDSLELVFVHGDLHVAGDLANQGMVVVTGDLVVDGCFWDADVGNQLVVLGQTRLGRLNLYGGARLAGDLWIDELLYGVDHSDTVQVAGNVRATHAGDPRRHSAGGDPPDRPVGDGPRQRARDGPRSRRRDRRLAGFRGGR